MAKYDLDEKSGIIGLFANRNIVKNIKVGSSVEFKHFKMFEFVNAIVVEKGEDTIKIETKEAFFETFFFPGDVVVINYSSGDNLYVLSGEISTVHNINPLVVNIKANKIEKLNNVRKHQRFYVSLMANIKSKEHVNPLFAVVKNISAGGIKVNCKEYLVGQDEVEVEVVLDRINKLTFMGAIVRKNVVKDYYEYGIEIAGINESNLKCLYHFLHWLDTDLK